MSLKNDNPIKLDYWKGGAVINGREKTERAGEL